MAAITASTLILESLRKLNYKELGGTLSTTEQPVYLSALNAFLEGQSLEALMVPYRSEDSLALTASIIRSLP